MKLSKYKLVFPCFLLTAIFLTLPVFAVSDQAVTCIMPMDCSSCKIAFEGSASLTDCGACSGTCPVCGIPSWGMGSGERHVWVEESRIEPTSTAPGQIQSRCSSCSAIKTETIPQLPDVPSSGGSLTLTALLHTMTDVFATICEWIGAVSAAVVSNPILLLGVVVGFIGTGVGLFRRLLSL